jgi:hypothetical protein
MLIGFIQLVEKEIQKAWHDCNIHQKILHPGYLVLLCVNKYLQHPKKLCMGWLGPFWLVYISEVGISKISTLQGHPLRGLINKNRLDSYDEPWGSTVIYPQLLALNFGRVELM